MLQAVRSRIRVPMWPLIFFFSILRVALGTGRFTQPLTEMSTRNRKKCFRVVERGWHLRLTTSPPSVSRMPIMWVFNISQPYRPPRSVTGIALLNFN
jgi:hypothetical protein